MEARRGKTPQAACCEARQPGPQPKGGGTRVWTIVEMEPTRPVRKLGRGQVRRCCGLSFDVREMNGLQHLNARPVPVQIVDDLGVAMHTLVCVFAQMRMIWWQIRVIVRDVRRITSGPEPQCQPYSGETY